MVRFSPPAPARLSGWRGALRAGLCLAAALLAGAVAAEDFTAELRRFENQGRAQPARAAQELQARLAERELDRATQTEALTVQGLLLAGVPDEAGAERVALALERLGDAGAAALLVRAHLADKTGATRRAVALIDDAMARLPPDAPQLARLRVVAARALIRGNADDLDDAIRYGQEAQKLADAQGDAWRRAEIRNTLAWVYYLAKQTARAASLNDEAVAIAAAAGETLTLSHASNMQAIVRDEQGDAAGARRGFEQALDYARRAGAKAEEAGYLANLADSHLKSAEYPLALRYAQQALPLTRELKNLNGETVALANIGLAQIALGDIEAGKRNLRASIAIDERRDSISGMSASYDEMGQYLEKAGDLAGAVESLHQYRALADQILRRDQQQAIFELQEQFDAEQRSKELELLRRDGELKSEQLLAHDLQQSLWWLLAGCGLLALLVVAMLARRVRDTNRELTQSNAQLQRLAEIDPLTGLANRRHFQERMQRIAADGRLEGTVFLIDIDHFKRINDRYGHAAGDAVLVEVARRMRAVLREQDLIVRWGGEEFLVVVRSLGAEAVQALAARMLDAIGGEPVEADAAQIVASASIGYASFPIEPTLLAPSWERAINLVDTALYLAKAHGRNRAYGVSRLHARDEAQLDAIARSLEQAWRDGTVALTLLRGPEAAAPPPSITELARCAPVAA